MVLTHEGKITNRHILLASAALSICMFSGLAKVERFRTVPQSLRWHTRLGCGAMYELNILGCWGAKCRKKKE